MSGNSQWNTTKFQAAIETRDAASLAEQLTSSQFVLIHVQEQGQSVDDELGALTADVDGDPCLVAFASERHAAEFVQQRGDVFESDDQVGGFIVSGDVMLDYLGDEYGLLINPETQDVCLVDRELVSDILDDLGLA